MNKPTFLKIGFVSLLLLLCFNSIAQTYKPFTVRENLDIRGSMLVIGNNILGKDNLPFNDLTKDNQDISMQYIDIDGDSSTFSSSSADLLLSAHDDGSATTCYRVAYAALYWGAVLQSGSRTDINKVKFKIPGSTDYIDIAGEVVYDAIVNPIIAVANEPGNTPYACYADVTNLLVGLSDIEGTYTVANVNSSLGFNNSTGLSAGWTLFVIYEDPILHTKSFTSFDGFSHIFDGHQETVPVTGFTTPQAGHIDLQFAYGTLDGDRTKRATKLEVNGKEVTTPFRPANKFFGSVIENTNGVANPRNPFSANTLGYDTGFLEILNSEPEFIKNNVSSADFRLQVARGQADPIFAFFAAFAVDIISPDIDLTKIVLDTDGNNIDGDNVYLGQNLFYEITYQSVGNDNVTEFTIKDVLPDNIIFDPSTDIDLSNAGGATLLSYDPVTRTIIFSIPDGSVEAGDPSFVIRLAIGIVPNCYDLSQACSNEIINQAFGTYRGVINTNWIQDEGSFATTECLGTPGSTNFLVDISNCNFQRTEILCGSSVGLTAADGYDSYSWSTSSTGTPVIGTGQTYTATSPGTYYVTNTTLATCISIEEAITVATYGNDLTNPVIPYADLLPACPNDGKVLPYIFLCGANDSRAIFTGISDAVSITWEQLDETSCPAIPVDDCANENDTCTWNQIATGPDYVANTAGQFRLVINYPGGCYNIFYFNVYQNLLVPTITAEDILCTTSGQVTIGSVPSGYEFSLDPNGPYQLSNTFTVNTPGYYTAYIRQIGVNTNPCIFETPSIYVRQRDFTVTSSVTQPDCSNDKGSISLAAYDALPQYYFSIYQGATLINSVGPILASDYTFANLNPGSYTVNVSTDDGCFYTENIVINQAPLITVTAALTKPLTCTDGEITVYPVGGTPPYVYYVNSTTVSQDTPVITATTAGVYDITVFDFNGCSASTSITVTGILPPEYTVSQTDVLCAGDNNGTTSFNVTNANGNSLLFSVDNGVTFFNSPIFTGLIAGNYETMVQYAFGADVCFTSPQTITITEPDPINGTVTVTSPYTCISNGTITVSGVTGGTSPYEYSIDGLNYQVGTTFTGLSDGTYTITLRDTNGCFFTAAPITINSLNPPTDMTFSNTALSCPSITSTVTINGTTGGVGALEYQIVAPAANATAYQSSNVFSGLAPGTYTFQVKDANDCTYLESYTIDPLPALSVIGQSISNISCFGSADGSALFTVSGPTTFTYTINGGASVAGTSPINLSSLASGTYTIVITDTITNCQATNSVTINGPTTALAITTIVTPITCVSSGSLTINAPGGWGGNTYELTLPDSTVLGPQGSNVFSNLSQIGMYTVTATDANGCQVTTTFTLNTPSNPIATIDASSDFCYDGNGSTLVVNASDGLPPYEYSINGGAFVSSNTFTNLIPGTYDIIVRDANGCTFALPSQTIANQLTASAVLTKRLDCTGSPDAVITGTISGGTPAYSVILVQGTGTPVLVGNTFTLTTSVTGNYQFQIIDASSCITLTNVLTIQPISLPSAIAIATDVYCKGDNSGIVTIDIDESLGEPPYLVSFNGSPYSAQTVYNGLTSGIYSYTVIDNNSCPFNGNIEIKEPSAITLGSETITPITCGGSGNILGSISISNVTGGTPNYTYSLLNSSGNFATTTSTNPFGPTSNNNVTFNDLAFGNYYLRVVDVNGCEYNFGPYLVASDVDNLDIVSNSSGSCLTGVSYNISIVNGVGPFRIRIYDGTPTFNPTDGVVPNGLPTSDMSLNERNHQFSGLLFDVSYVFEVLDTDTGCTYIEQILAEPNPSNIAVTGSPTNVTCYELPALDNGIFDFSVTGYTGTSLSWEVFDNLTNLTTGITGNASGLTGTDYSDSATNLSSGDYYLLVRETDPSPASTECTAVIKFRIIQPTELFLTEVVNTNANCNQDAQVAVNGSGGTPPYEYAFVEDGIGPITSNWTTSNLAFLDYMVNSNWDVYVRDANGCSISVPLDVVIGTDPLPSVTLPSFAVDQCTSTGNLYTFTATPGGGEITPVSYSIDGVNFQSSSTFTVSSDGTYTVTIRDGNGCSATDTITIYPPLQVNAFVSAQPSCTAGGTITVNGAGGSGSYSFVLLDNLANPTGYVISGSDFTGVLAGDYIVEITDTVTGCSSQPLVSLETPTPVSFTTLVSDLSCNGGSDGMITVSLVAGNDNPPYTYEITAPISFGPQSSNIFTGLPAGTYDITVTSGRDCSLSQQATVGEPNLLRVSGTATDFGCAPDNYVNASALTITEVGGTSPYLYSIDGINYFTSNTFDIIDTGSPQNIDIYVKDANGCIASDSVSITPLPTLTAASVATATPIDCNTTGTITITVTGGSSNFDYQMLPNGTPQPSNTFSITDPGTYYFQVNDLDTGCSIATSAFTVAPFDTIDVMATPTTAITCFGDNNGAFEINVSGYSGTYDYEVFNDSGVSVAMGNGDTALANPLTINGMSAGNFTVEVTETASPFCIITSNMFTIDSPASALVVSVSETSNVTCDDNSGTITAVASGGWGTYEYELTGTAAVPYSSNGIFTNLSAGSYTVNVRDAGGCIASDNVTLVIPPPINATVTPSTTTLSCFGDTNASIIVTNVTGGQGNNYSYTLNMIIPTVSSSGPQVSPVFSGLGAGTYTIDVTDGYNCVFTSANIVITEPTEIQADLVKATNQTCLTDARLTLSATGGTGSYEYSNTDTFTTTLGSFATSITFSVSAGTHQYYVRDTNGCVSNVSNEIQIDPLPPLVINLDVSNATVNCTGDTTGVIVATAQGGLGNYVYTLQDVLGNDLPATQNSPGIFTDLPAGNYRVKVDSGDCLTTSATIPITEPALPLVVNFTVTDATCPGINNGVLEINASGGTGIIKYAISPQLNQFFETSTFENLSPGTYQAMAQDELGCFVIFDFTVVEPVPVSLSIVPNSIIPEICDGDLDGEFSIDISGGNMPYSVSLDTIDGPYTIGALAQTQFDFIGLNGGDHIVYVRDNLGCETEWNITFPEPVLINPLAVVDYGCVNNSLSNTVTVTVDASITNLADLDYSLDGGPYQASNVFTDVVSGLNHYIDVRHTNGCIKRTPSFDIAQYSPLALILEDGGLNEIVAVTTGGSGNYEYTLNGESFGSTNTFIIYESGNYTVTVTDSFGCVASATKYFEYIDVCITNYFTPNDDGNLDEWGPGCTSQYKDLTFSIFDRYGRKIATLRVGQKWDGKYNGIELPTGDYWYVVKLNDKKDNREFVGHFTLYR